MELAEAVRTRLLAASAVTTLVGSGADARIYWNKRDQGGALPALVLAERGGAPDDLDLAGGTDFSESRVQGSCLAATYMQARALAKAFSETLMGEATVGGSFDFWSGERERPIDLGSDEIDGTFVHEVTQDVILRHSPSA